MRPLLAICAILSFGLLSTTAEAKPHCKACPYSCDGLGLAKKDCSELGQSGALCCVDLSKKGLKAVYAQEQTGRHPGDTQPLKVTSNTPKSCPSGSELKDATCQPAVSKKKSKS
jgi:hypothetical protein